jgi:hypothetical protein
MNKYEFEPDSQNPAAIIEREFERLRGFADEQILSELEALPVLPDEDNCCTDEDENNIWLYIALADQAKERRLRAAIPLILERASYGDPMETMRSMDHWLWGIVRRGWGEGHDEAALIDPLIEATKSLNRGARLWAVTQLSYLYESYGERGRQAIQLLLDDSAELVRKQARRSLGLE